MLGMTGVELSGAIRSQRAGTPVLLVSGYVENEGISPDMPRLSKPFRKDELAAALALLTGNPKVEAGGRTYNPRTATKP